VCDGASGQYILVDAALSEQAEQTMRPNKTLHATGIGAVSLPVGHSGVPSFGSPVRELFR
jgi:hypothetical protein